MSEAIIALIAAKRKIDSGMLSPADPLDELGLDSLQVVELIFDIEERFDIEIPINANSDLEAKTLGDLIASVESLAAAKAGVR